MGVGTNILGYCNSRSRQFSKTSSSNNMHCKFTLNCVGEVYLAEKLISLLLMADEVKFARTGGEANQKP